MKKAIKITLGIVVVLALACWALDIALHISHEQVYGGKEKYDLVRLGRTIQELGEANRLTPDVLDRLDSANNIAELIGPHHETKGQYAMNDVRGKPYSVDLREDGDRIFLTIRSSFEMPRTWYRRRSDTLGIEITITQSDGKVTQIRKLWDSD